MKKIPSDINGVVMELASGVTNEITDEMFDAMRYAIKKNVAAGYTLNKLWVSSAKDSHSCPSRHTTGNGVDISRVNGKYLSNSYDSDLEVKNIVDELQTTFESAPKRRENYGPTIKKKEGEDNPVSGHKDHFHWSVNGDHSACNSFFLRIWSGIYSWFSSKKEVCDR